MGVFHVPPPNGQVHYMEAAVVVGEAADVVYVDTSHSVLPSHYLVLRAGAILFHVWVHETQSAKNHIPTLFVSM